MAGKYYPVPPSPASLVPFIVGGQVDVSMLRVALDRVDKMEYDFGCICLLSKPRSSLVVQARAGELPLLNRSIRSAT